jgi:hypothetical protein
MSARRERAERNPGPTVFLLARRAEVLNDSIVVRGGKLQLKDNFPSDAANALAWMRATKIITQAEWQAGEHLSRLRANLFGFGVVPAASFYGRMCAVSPSSDDGNRHIKTDEEKIADAERNIADYEEAMMWLTPLNPNVKLTLQKLCGDWWPEQAIDVIWAKKGLQRLALKWNMLEREPVAKPVMALDFDGVLHMCPDEDNPDQPLGEAVEGAIDFILEAKDVFAVAVTSWRSAKPNGVNTIRAWLQKQLQTKFGNDTGEVWRHLSELSIPVFKPRAHIALDDRAFCFNGDFKRYKPMALANFKPWYAR